MSRRHPETAPHMSRSGEEVEGAQEPQEAPGLAADLRAADAERRPTSFTSLRVGVRQIRRYLRRWRQRRSGATLLTLLFA